MKPDGPEQEAQAVLAAQERERARLAQEVHDGPAQALSNAIFQVDYIERLLGREADREVARGELSHLRALLERELGNVRSFISHLRPPLLDELGLEGAIRDAVDKTAALTRIPVTAELDAPSATLSPAQQTVVLRVAQEALQNVRKHASASAVSVATRVEDGGWVLEVRDDGRGFVLAAATVRGRRSFGLQFMRERAELIGATFEVRSRPDGGTVVRLVVPMGAEERT